MKTRLKNATLSLRVPIAFWDTDAGFKVFREFAAEFRFVEEYAFFSTPLIGRAFPVGYLRGYWEKLGERIEKTRSFAPRVGINHLVNHQGTPVTFNFCPVNPVWREEYIKPTYALLAQCRPDFIDLIVENNRRLPLKGIWNGIGRDYFLGNNCGSGQWFDLEKDSPMGFQPWRCIDLHVIGLPPAFRRQDATVIAMGEREVAALSDEELFDLLHGGLYLDVPALEAINRRDVVQIFWGSIAYSLAPAAGAERIGRLVNIVDDELAACSSGIFTNNLGGRIAAIGYAPWHGLGYAHKAAQIKKIFRWLSGDTLPGWVDSCHRSGLWLRPRPDGGINATVLNASMDPAGEMIVTLKTHMKLATLYRLEHEPVQLTATDHRDGYTRFMLPDLDHWSIGYLVTA